MSAGDKKMYDTRKALGICVDCAAPVDYAYKYVRCKACRKRHTEYQKEWRKLHPKPALTLKEQAMLTAREKAMNEAAKREIAAAKINRKLEKCKKCEWGTYTGGKVLCPFPEGVCMKQ